MWKFWTSLSSRVASFPPSNRTLQQIFISVASFDAKHRRTIFPTLLNDVWRYPRRTSLLFDFTIERVKLPSCRFIWLHGSTIKGESADRSGWNGSVARFLSVHEAALERWKGGRFRDVSIPISCISPHISREQVNFFQVGTSNKAFQIYLRRETRRGQRRVISATVLADNRVVRESFIAQGARLFIPFHFIPFHCIAFQASKASGYWRDLILCWSRIFLLYIYFFFFYLFFYFFHYNNRIIYAIYRGDSLTTHSFVRSNDRNIDWGCNASI